MRELRKIAGLRENEVAAELGLHYNTISVWERTDREILKAYAEVFQNLVNDVERVYWIKNTRRERRLTKRQNRVAQAFGGSSHGKLQDKE